MPRELVQQLGAALSGAQRQPDVAKQLIDAGSPAFIIEPDALKAYVDAEVVKYLRLAREAGIQPE
jgi:tripartite-type tricarboxylate transporter receptor subunit TctC